ncbi:MAG TPA: GNAT family N-acetyltransferase [Alcaligenes sp.]|nr:GNAT family N-acetyltransferase [Alcaligenes sp.]HRL27824.1 GNAT family N-acetyltransferase [Alcaligenes sp.]
MSRFNEFQQAIGQPLPHWQTRPYPARITLTGHYGRLEALDPLRHGDSLYQAYSLAPDSRDWTYLSVGPFQTRNEFDQYLARIAQATDAIHYAVIDPATERALGTLALMRIDPSNGVIEVGFVAWSPLLKKTRLATEAHYLLMHYAIEQLGYRRYEWKCDANNAPSRAAAARLGFSFEGIFRHAMIYKGRSRDTAWFSITDQEWPMRKAALQTWLHADNFDAQGRQRRRLGAAESVCPAAAPRGALRLEQMLSLQQDLNILINPQWRRAPQPYYRAVWIECAELAGHLDWKWWQHTERQLPQLQLELVDILHFGLCDLLLHAHSELHRQAACALEKLADANGQAVDTAAILNALERFAQISLQSRRFDFPAFGTLAGLCGMTLDSLFQAYVGKNALNRLRQMRGYQQGNYQKHWQGREDNLWLAELQAQPTTLDAQYPATLLQSLIHTYDTLTACEG